MNMLRFGFFVVSGGVLFSIAACGSDSQIDLGTGGSGGSTSSSSTSSTSTSSGETASSSSSGGSSSSSTSSSSSSSGSGGDKFSFFVTSLKALQDLSGSPDGFGGDLRFGETGPGSGLRGADKICATIAEKSMPGAGAKPWRAFLSATADENGNPVHARDRIGEGPWYDRLGRLLAENKTNLLNQRPLGGDSAIVNDFPNEEGVPNHQPDPNQPQVDNHDTLTGTNTQGMLNSSTSTCKDWTSALGDVATEGKPRIGHMWPRLGGPGGGANWMMSHDAGGCAPGVVLLDMGGPAPGDYSVGAGGGYGAIYCFSLVP